ncbi:dTDP-4-dehydrorhamnose reductase [Citreimonas salinaria]|uniref:dTDP-4-dehydrorhamnose reductase n=1 Tax=Citreimonas salinaria TaxID=321339 RepID=A0A1H3EXF7_9RHOB|nr:dTDP-4-dehydrorhamnose reductase [Citreimonas salinaria]SDX83492.1 dTDP-4-dehydrorhamnose reductase [Citreimonas salinaria]
MILVFGHSGQVATELRRVGGVTALGRDAFDLRDPHSAARAIDAHDPLAVINAAAWTAVDAAETAESDALVLNAEAPGALGRACAARDIPLVHVSTDYVFDGTGTTPWHEDDAPAPLGAYGRTKLAGEHAVRAAGGPHVILRTSWVFSAHGSNFVRTMLRLSDTRDRVSVVADQVGGPTPAADVAGALLHMAQALRDGHRGGTYHLAGAPHVSWAGFAREIFDAAGRDTLIDEVTTARYPTPAPRPLNSRLDCAAIMRDFKIPVPDWRAGLRTVLKELGH